MLHGIMNLIKWSNKILLKLEALFNSSEIEQIYTDQICIEFEFY